MKAALFTILLLGVATAGHAQLAGLHDPREKHLAHVRQLTFGGQNAEAYWSPDSKRLTFQAMTGAMKADQIYTMTADGKRVRRVSTGEGRCTCSFFVNGGKEILFASTHGFSPAIPPDPDRSQGYVWPIYDTYAIWIARPDGSNLRPLYPPVVQPGVKTGYNAEAVVSPDGKRVLFTSTRNGDLDLYTMNVDGTGLRQITNTLGYDGGGFFSPDGKKIVWRANHPQTPEAKLAYLKLLRQNLVRPTVMELWVADSDGANARQITNNGAANFAPFFTPDGQKILFASNVDDPQRRSFELYLINLDGTGLERVTYGAQFDSFPMFSPDGKRLVWASNRNGKDHETNIFVADWVP
jgi:Tol biopolymer transport system component